MRLATAAALALAVAASPLATASAGILSAPPLPAASAVLATADVEMTVSNSYGYANLRAKPSTSGKLLDKLPQGTKVTVIETVAGGTWAHVKVGGKEGYIQAKLLK
jgi:uncharacterized protein YgiM (DUF1202 family)